MRHSDFPNEEINMAAGLQKLVNQVNTLLVQRVLALCVEHVLPVLGLVASDL